MESVMRSLVSETDNHGLKLMEEMTNGKIFDTTFVIHCPEPSSVEQQVYGSRSMLALHSEYFRRQLDEAHGMCDTGARDRFDIREAKPSCFLVVMLFVHGAQLGFARLPMAELMAVYVLADRFIVKDLCSLLEKEMRERLHEMRTVADILTILRAAFLDGPVWPAAHACVDRLLPHGSDELLKSPALNELSEKAVILLMESDRLAASEDEIFLVCQRWAVANESVSASNPVGSLWPCIRLPILSPRVIACDIATDQNKMLTSDQKVELLRWATGDVPLRNFTCQYRMIKQTPDGRVSRCYQCKEWGRCWDKNEENPIDRESYVFCRRCFRAWMHNELWEPRPCYILPSFRGSQPSVEPHVSSPIQHYFVETLDPHGMWEPDFSG